MFSVQFEVELWHGAIVFEQNWWLAFTERKKTSDRQFFLYGEMNWIFVLGSNMEECEWNSFKESLSSFQ
jgi:hypothetical protein